LELGVDSIFAHVSAYANALNAGLVARGFESARATHPRGRSAIVSVRHPRFEAATIAAELGERGVSCTMPEGYLRFAPHWPNSHDELPKVLETMDETLSALAF
jgi:cysteine desulfurase/selenocysteine lyase